MISKHESIVYDRWLSQVLNRDVYDLRVDEDLIRQAVDDKSVVSKQLDELQAGKVFIYSKILPQVLTAVSFLESRGFNLVDTGIVFEKPVSKESKTTSQITIRLAVPEDRDVVVELAGKSFTYSRFHLDRAFRKDEADSLKREWVANYFNGNRGDAMVVAEADMKVIGFLLLIFGKDSRLIIDLIAVGEQQRRKGIAEGMIIRAESEYSKFSTISAGTQLANTPSLRFYERMGFRISMAKYVFHYHHSAEQR